MDGKGWKQPSSSSLVVDWDSIENTTHVREMVALIKKGSGCRTGCHSSHCKCKKGGNYTGLDVSVLSVAMYQPIVFLPLSTLNMTQI